MPATSTKKMTTLPCVRSSHRQNRGATRHAACKPAGRKCGPVTNCTATNQQHPASGAPLTVGDGDIIAVEIIRGKRASQRHVARDSVGGCGALSCGVQTLGESVNGRASEASAHRPRPRTRRLSERDVSTVYTSRVQALESSRAAGAPRAPTTGRQPGNSTENGRRTSECS